MGGFLFSWWLARKQRRSDAEDGRRPWETLTAQERQSRLRQVAEQKKQTRPANRAPGPA